MRVIALLNQVAMGSQMIDLSKLGSSNYRTMEQIVHQEFRVVRLRYYKTVLGPNGKVLFDERTEPVETYLCKAENKKTHQFQYDWMTPYEIKRFSNYQMVTKPTAQQAIEIFTNNSLYFKTMYESEKQDTNHYYGHPFVVCLQGHFVLWRTRYEHPSVIIEYLQIEKDQTTTTTTVIPFSDNPRKYYWTPFRDRADKLLNVSYPYFVFIAEYCNNSASNRGDPIHVYDTQFFTEGGLEFHLGRYYEPTISSLITKVVPHLESHPSETESFESNSSMSKQTEDLVLILEDTTGQTIANLNHQQDRTYALEAAKEIDLICHEKLEEMEEEDETEQMERFEREYFQNQEPILDLSLLIHDYDGKSEELSSFDYFSHAYEQLSPQQANQFYLQLHSEGLLVSPGIL